MLQDVWSHREEGEICSMFNFLFLLQMNAVGITENVKGDHRKFEIWYSGREEVYVVQVCSFENRDICMSS